MKVKHIDLLSSKKNSTNVMNVLMEKILPECVGGLDKGELESFLVGDQYAIFLGLRRETWGDLMEYSIECPQCEEKGEFAVDLSTLKMRPLPQPETTGFKFTDRNEHEISWHLPTIGEMVRTQKDIEEQSKLHGGEYDFSTSFGTAMYIDEIYGVTDQAVGTLKIKAIRQYVLNQGVRWLFEFTEIKEEKECGYDFEARHSCSGCGETFEAEVPVLQSFFSMDRKGKKAKMEKQRASFLNSSSESSSTPPSPPASVSPTTI